MTHERWSSAATLTDAELQALFRQDSAAAFSELYRRHKASVYGYLCRSRLPRAVCDELCQDVFVKVHRAFARYDARGSLKSWVLTIAVNTVRSYLRGPGARAASGSSDNEAVSLLPSALENSVGRELLAAIEAVLPGLPEAEREAIILVGIECMDQSEAAAVLSVPLNTLKTNLRRARLKLRDRLAARGHDWSGTESSRGSRDDEHD